MARKGGLGKGLEALFQDNGESSDQMTLKLSEIEPNRSQPRKEFDEAALATLADSIRQHGLIQPLLVRPMANGSYQIIAGERRWRACRMLGLSEVPVILKEMDDRQVMEVALIENLQREDLNPMEEARGYHELMETYHMTQDQVANSVGKSRPAIANMLRLLQLPDEVTELVEQGKLSFGQAKAILSFEDPKTMTEIAKETVKNGLTVRKLEAMAKKQRQSLQKVTAPTTKRDHFFDELEIAMQEELHRKIKIDLSKGEKGTLHIDFYSKDELADIAKRLSNMN